MRAAAALAILIAFMSSPTAWADEVVFDPDDPTPVVRYQEIIPALQAAEPGPSVEVFADGRVLVRFPAYMRRAGIYELHLSAERRDALFQALVEDGVADFNEDAVAQARDDLRRERRDLRRNSRLSAERHLRTDPTSTVIETRLSRRSAQVTKELRAARWVGLRGDAEMYPELRALSRLATAEQRLRALMDDPDLRALE